MYPSRIATCCGLLSDSEMARLGQLVVVYPLVVAAAAAGSSPGVPPSLVGLPLNDELCGQRSDGRPFVLRRVSERPHAFLLKGFLSADECDALMEHAKLAGFEAAETTGQTRARRNCEVALLSPSRQRVLAAIQSDAARTLLSTEELQTSGGGVEELNVLCYRPGGEYSAHCIRHMPSSRVRAT